MLNYKVLTRSCQPPVFLVKPDKTISCISRVLFLQENCVFIMEKEDLKRQVEMLRIHKDLQRIFVSDAVKE